MDVLEVQPDVFGWTAIVPGLRTATGGFPRAIFAKTWDLSDGHSARLGERFKIPLAPFCGVMGVAPAEPGEHSTMPPRRTGGNVDIKQLVSGSTMYLPVEVDGALFVGDAHAAQGDGEVCVSAIEMSATVTLRFTVRADLSLQEPQFQTPGLQTPASTGPSLRDDGARPGPACGRQAGHPLHAGAPPADLRSSKEDAYCLASVAVDLKISEVVDAPNWIVSAFLPLEIVT